LWIRARFICCCCIVRCVFGWFTGWGTWVAWGLQLACLLVVCVVWIDSWRIFRTERRRNYIPIPLHLRTLCKYGTYT
jgi:hypothetical protein